MEWRINVSALFQKSTSSTFDVLKSTSKTPMYFDEPEVHRLYFIVHYMYLTVHYELQSTLTR